LTHNHPPSESPTEHPGARKLDPKAIAAVKALEENGMSSHFSIFKVYQGYLQKYHISKE